MQTILNLRADRAALTQEREGYKRDFLAASERVGMREAALTDARRALEQILGPAPTRTTTTDHAPEWVRSIARRALARACDAHVARLEAAEADARSVREKMEHNAALKRIVEALHHGNIEFAKNEAALALASTGGGYPVRLTKAEARLLMKLLTARLDYPELEAEHQALYDKLEAVL